MTEPSRRLVGQWTPAELGVHQVIGGGPMPVEELRRTGDGDAVQTLLARDPSRQVTMDASQPFRPGDQRAVARLLAALREAGAAEAVRTLAVRAGDAGMFGLFLEAQPGEAAAYRFGREPAGTPSPPWTWSAPTPA